MSKISVVLCAHNPNPNFLQEVINSLKSQTLPLKEWELVIVDNNSHVALNSLLDLSWHPEHKVVVEERLGLIHARIRGTKEARHAIQVSVDDDTPLFPDYLENVVRIYETYPDLGIIGGRTIARFLATPPAWLPEFYTSLAIRDLGEQQIIEKLNPNEAIIQYPRCAPILIAPKKECMEAYFLHYKESSVSQSLGRKGSSLASGEDNDINLFIYKQGYALGYFPELKFYHIIPEQRMTREYLSRLQYSMNATWIKVLAQYGIKPWRPISRWSVKLRMMKAWLTCRAWRDDVSYIRWKAACGKFQGLSELKT